MGNVYSRELEGEGIQGAQATGERVPDQSRRRTTQVNHGGVSVEGPGGPRPVSQDPRVARDGDESPTGTFQRGGRLRSSLPVVRSPNKSLERPMGLVFLVFRNETKRALMPNEITSMDTVRALFVRSFSECLSMQWFDIPSHKIYILDPKTNVFYELDDTRDVKDRVVLKIYETGFPPTAPGSPNTHSPQTPDYLTLHCHHAGYESDSSARSAPTGSGVRSPLHHPPLSPRIYQTSKPQTLPSHHSTYACPQQLKGQYMPIYAPGGQPAGPQPHGQTPHPPGSHYSPTLRSHPTSGPPQTRESHYMQPHSNQSSPQRTLHVQQTLPPNQQRHSVAYLPDPNAYSEGRMPQSRSCHEYHPEGVPSNHSSGSATPTHPGVETKVRMDNMEAQLANLAAWVQTTVLKNQSDNSRPGSARSNSSVVSDGSYSAKSKSESETPLQSPASSIRQGMSDVSSATPQPMISIDMQNTIRNLNHRSHDLRSEVTKLRRLQVTNMENMRETIHDTYKKIKEVIDVVPGAADQPIRAQRQSVNRGVHEYKDETKHITQDLMDLEKSVEDLRNDVLNRKCRVNVTEVENMALALSTITKSLGDLKAQFPSLQKDMKTVMQGEMKVVVQEEMFIKDEPDKLDTNLKRCKKLTGTLATLRRLAMVQEHKEPIAPTISCMDSNEEDRLAVLDNIKAVIPDHGTRLASVQAAEGARERKKKIDSRGEALRFEKSLAIAHKQLKESKDRGSNGLRTVEEEAGDAQLMAQRAKSVTAAIIDSPTKPDHVNGVSDQVLLSNEESFLAHCKDEENYISALRLSAFDNSPISKRSEESSRVPESPQIIMSSQPPLSPTSTSTPKSQGHVKFNSTIAEISVSSSMSSTPGQDGKKKIPPPPPPRRSSRNNVQTPSPTSERSEFILPGHSDSHMYENLDDLNLTPPSDSRKKDTDKKVDVSKVKDVSKAKVNDTLTHSSPKSRAQRPKSTSDMLVQEKPKQERPKSHYSPTKGGPQTPTKGQTSPTRPLYSPTKMKQLNKFQHELAAGIYSNLNRPDLQGQKINPARVVHDASSPEEPSSNSSSSTSLDSQLGGTIKRNKNAKSNKQDKSAAPDGKTSPTDKSRKIPPPPPQRKTSTLTTKDSLPADKVKPEVTKTGVKFEVKSEGKVEMESEVKTEVRSEVKDGGSGGGVKKDFSPPSPSRLQAQYDKLKLMQQEYIQKQLQNGASTHNGGVATTVGGGGSSKNSNNNASASTADTTKKPSTSPVQNTSKIPLGGTTSRPQSASSSSRLHGNTPPATLPKKTSVHNGEVSKSAKDRVGKSEVGKSRAFEETEIY